MTDKLDIGCREENGKKYEMICGIILAFLAAILALTNVASGRVEGNQMVAVNNKTEAYSWYNTKSIKQTLVQGQHDILEALLIAGSINEDAVPIVESEIERYSVDAERYNKEKNEILRGSKAVGEENWAQDIEGEMGVVVGAREYETLANKLDLAGNIFDLATMFLEISLVIGAISLLMESKRTKSMFFNGMILAGVIGITIAVNAIWQGWEGLMG